MAHMRHREREKERGKKVNFNFRLFFTQFLKNNPRAYSCSWLLSDLHNTQRAEDVQISLRAVVQR